MGDVTTSDLERFMRSPEGKKELEEIREALSGRMIVDVTFNVDLGFIGTTLHFRDGGTLYVSQPSLDRDFLRDAFADVLDREYYKEHPEQRQQGQKS